MLVYRPGKSASRRCHDRNTFRFACSICIFRYNLKGDFQRFNSETGQMIANRNEYTLLVSVSAVTGPVTTTSAPAANDTSLDHSEMACSTFRYSSFIHPPVYVVLCVPESAPVTPISVRLVPISVRPVVFVRLKPLWPIPTILKCYVG